jgi:hypothetical protein
VTGVGVHNGVVWVSLLLECVEVEVVAGVGVGVGVGVEVVGGGVVYITVSKSFRRSPRNI